jgi:flagellar basal body rod protein FlgC
MSDFAILGAAASGMQAQRQAMDVEARNVALAQTGDARHPAHGLVPDFADVLASSGASSDDGDPGAAIDAFADDTPAGDAPDGAAVVFAGAHVSAAPIDSISEMINVMDSQRAYEANASIFDIGKRLAERTIDMGRL